jgi:hypothetical protein
VLWQHLAAPALCCQIVIDRCLQDDESKVAQQQHVQADDPASLQGGERRPSEAWTREQEAIKALLAGMPYESTTNAEQDSKDPVKNHAHPNNSFRIIIPQSTRKPIAFTIPGSCTVRPDATSTSLLRPSLSPNDASDDGLHAFTAYKSKEKQGGTHRRPVPHADSSVDTYVLPQNVVFPQIDSLLALLQRFPRLF